MADPNTVLTRSTNFSKLENGQRVTTFSVRTNMKLGDGVSQVSIVDANGNVIAQGTAQDVAAQLRANPSSRQNDDFIRAVETHDAGLQAARAKATPSQTAAEPPPAQSTTTPVDPTSDAAGKIDKGNTPPAVAPVDSAPNVAITLPAPEEVASGRGLATVDLTPPAEDSSAKNNPPVAKSSAVENQKTNAEQSGKILGFNPLDELADYTYSFILSFLGPSDYNAIIRNPDSAAQYVKNNVIIASGSRNSETLKRNPEFTYDFFISELKFDTIVGLNSRTKGSNAFFPPSNFPSPPYSGESIFFFWNGS